MPRKTAPQWTVRRQLPANGLDGVQVGEIYERAALTKDQLAIARELWRMRAGTIVDRVHRGVEIVQFMERR